MMNLKTIKYILWGFIAITVVTICVMMYKVFFEFNNTLVQRYLKEEAAKYQENQQAAYSILHEGVMHILTNRHLSNQVKREAENSGVPKEQILVASALIQARQLGYLA